MTANPKPWPAEAVELWPLERLREYENNARTHSPDQVEQIARSMTQWGWTNPVLVDETGELIAGHGRLLAARRLGYPRAPVMVARGWTEEQKRAYRIADNQLALKADWSAEALRGELADLEGAGFELDLIGFDPDELAGIMADDDDGDQGGEDEPAPDVEEVAITRPGEVWILGPHRVMCGDSTNADDVLKLMAGERARVLHADPPYGYGKEADGVANDNLYGDKLDAFQLAWWRACRPHVADNGSAYIWGAAPDLWRLWYKAGLGESEPLTFRNEIVWDKQSIAGMKSGDMNCYPEASERCLFFQLGRYVLRFNQTQDDYWEGWDPLRLYMVEQRDAMGWTAGDVKRICGNHMYGHWFGRSQWAFITRENYEKLQAAAGACAFQRSYDDLHAEYRELARVFNNEVRDPLTNDFLNARPYFDNAHDIMRDTWTFPRVAGEERFGHATPKPVAMMERVCKSSARPGELVLEPFGGTGSTLIGAQKSGRRCYTMELEPRYVDVIVRRWQSMTGQWAQLEGGETFKAVADARSQA
jgi:DNA modification methylase